MSSTRALRTLLDRPGLHVMPGVYDMVSARLAEAAGFEALYMTGFGTVASNLGLPDAGLATYTEMVERVRRLADTVTVPFAADGDTGYGGLLNVAYTVRGYERAGASAIQLEDQESPKKCGHTPGRVVVPADDMVLKIQVAAETRSSPDFLIIARTDARSAHGLDEALRRAELYRDAGADVLFVESPETEEEIRLIASRLGGTLLINQVSGGRTPVLSMQDLESLGYRIVIHPVTALMAAAAAMERAYAGLRKRELPPEDLALFDFDRFNHVIGFDDVRSFERRWSERR